MPNMQQIIGERRGTDDRLGQRLDGKVALEPRTSWAYSSIIPSDRGAWGRDACSPHVRGFSSLPARVCEKLTRREILPFLGMGTWRKGRRGKRRCCPYHAIMCGMDNQSSLQCIAFFCIRASADDRHPT